MNNFLKSRHFKILLGLLVMLISFMLHAAWTGGISPVITQTVGFIVTPLQKISASISDTLTKYFDRYLNAADTEAQNIALREEVNALREQLIEQEQHRKENDMLKSFLGIKEQNPDFVLEPASVVARDPNNRAYSFTIDKGYLSGIQPQDPVISSDGLVGVVKEVGPNYAKVLTILDVAVDVGAYDVRTRDIGVVEGSIEIAADGYCRMVYLPRESGIAKGDLVATSGGGIFPRGLVIGHVEDVQAQGGGISIAATIKPAANIRTVTDVMVIKSFEGQEEVADES